MHDSEAKAQCVTERALLLALEENAIKCNIKKCKEIKRNEMEYDST